jgi:hypothetical protein
VDLAQQRGVGGADDGDALVGQQRDVGTTTLGGLDCGDAGGAVAHNEGAAQSALLGVEDLEG